MRGGSRTRGLRTSKSRRTRTIAGGRGVDRKESIPPWGITGRIHRVKEAAGVERKNLNGNGRLAWQVEMSIVGP